MIYMHTIDCLCYQGTNALLVFPAHVSSFTAVAVCKPIYQEMPGKTVYLYYDPAEGGATVFHQHDTDGAVISQVYSYLRTYQAEPASEDEIPLSKQVSFYFVGVGDNKLSNEQMEEIISRDLEVAKRHDFSLMVYVNGQRVYER